MADDHILDAADVRLCPGFRVAAVTRTPAHHLAKLPSNPAYETASEFLHCCSNLALAAAQSSKRKLLTTSTHSKPPSDTQSYR